ncbi:MAG TPA: hypothetical protein VI749_01935, partial [Candidatus Omnitrophota bacterium]|nr:hypothetical protein [Candidatus Omnitrophota bacterium]
MHKHKKEQNKLMSMMRALGIAFLTVTLIYSHAFAQSDIEAILDTDDGTTGLSVQDSNTAEVMRVDSDGNVFLDGDLSVSGNDITMGVNTAGYILIGDGVNFTPTAVTGDGTLTATGSFTIVPNAVTLATDTTGDYVQLIVAGDGISSTGASTGENIAHTLDVDLKTVAQDAVGSTNSVSGLEFITGELTMLQGCLDSQILKWEEDDDSWHCVADVGGAGFNTLDESYDEGGSGAGRTITVDSGAVQLIGSGSDEILEVTSSGTGGVVFIENTSTGLSLRVNDEAADTTPIVIDASGQVGIGVAVPTAALDIRGTLFIENASTDVSFQVNDEASDATPFTISAAGVVTTGADATIGGDLTVTGNDITMAVNTAGYLLIADGTDFTPTAMTGDGTLSATGTFTITANSVWLGTDTTGNYVARIIPGDGLDTTGATTGENITHTLSIDLPATAIASATTGSFSGLEFVSGELTVLQGCSDNQILKWDETLDRWQCATDEDAGATATLQDTYNRDADGGNATITITGTDGAVIFQNPTVTGITTGTLFVLNQDVTTGVGALNIDSEGTDDYAVKLTHQGDGATVDAAGLFIEAESGAGAVYIHRNQVAATTDGTLLFVHEDGAADTDVVQITNEGTGDSLVVYDQASDTSPFVITAGGALGIGTTTVTASLTVAGTVLIENATSNISFRVNDEASDTTPFVINADGQVGIGTTAPSATLDVQGNAVIDGDLTVTGNDITMATNTAGYILLSDGTSFSPDGLTGDGTLSATGTFTITANSVWLGTDTTGNYVARIVAGDGIDSTGASTTENVQHTLSVDLLGSAVAGATTGSFSGLEFVSGELTVIQGCTNGDVLQWDDTAGRWGCDTDDGAGG